VGGLLIWNLGTATQEPSHHPEAHRQAAAAKGPVRITPEELHRHGGVPPGWQFSLPPGDLRAGREVFIKMECYSCHRVAGEPFPQGRKEQKPGPDLSGMGDMHSTEYLAEAIMNPNAVILTGPGFTGPDGLSTMPDYSELLTLRQLLDLVAYLKSLTSKGEIPHRGH
jgi:hypothetical protein